MKLFSNFIFNAVLIIISFNIISSESNFSLIFPFKTIEKEEPELTTSYNVTITNEIMKNIFLNELFLKLEIGSPPQKINLRVSVNSNDFFVSKEDITFEKIIQKNKAIFIIIIQNLQHLKFSQIKKEMFIFLIFMNQNMLWII